jgi:putative phage-type endonuclease
MSGQLVTPTGRLVTEAEPATPAWFIARRNGITGTDLPKILGLTPKYGNALTVWRDKRGESSDDDAGEAAEWGNIFEEPIAQKWASLEKTTVRRVGVLENKFVPWMRASLDRLVGLCPDGDTVAGLECGLEVKTRNAYKAGEFRDGIPDDVLAQVQWGLRVTGLPHMHVAVVIGGQKLYRFRVDRDAELEAYLFAQAESVWMDVQLGHPPDVAADAEGTLLRELNDMFRKREGDRELPGAAAQVQLDSYREGHRIESQGKAAKTVAKTELVKMLGDGEVGLLDGVPAFTYRRPDPTDELTAGQLRRLAVTAPNLYSKLVAEGYITQTKPNPKFNLKSRSTEE